MITTSYNSKRSSLEKESMVTSKKNTKKLVTSLTSHLTSKSESFAPQHFYFWCYLLKTHIIIFSSNGICATEQITEPKQSETEAYWPSTQKLGQADPGDHRIKAMSFYNKNKKTGRSETNISNNYMSKVILIYAIKHKSSKFIKLLTKGFIIYSLRTSKLLILLARLWAGHGTFFQRNQGTLIFFFF